MYTKDVWGFLDGSDLITRPWYCAVVGRVRKTITFLVH